MGSFPRVDSGARPPVQISKQFYPVQNSLNNRYAIEMTWPPWTSETRELRFRLPSTIEHQALHTLDGLQRSQHLHHRLRPVAGFRLDHPLNKFDEVLFGRPAPSSQPPVAHPKILVPMSDRARRHRTAVSRCHRRPVLEACSLVFRTSTCCGQNSYIVPAFLRHPRILLFSCGDATSR